MKNVTVYSTKVCPYCMQAKALLQSLKVPFDVVDLSDNFNLRQELADKYNWQTVPMIVIGEEFIGGYDDLKKLHDGGQLMPKLTK